MTPQARCDRLIVQEMGEETVIYDEQRDRIHLLNRTAALVWGRCDGTRTASEIAGILQGELAAPVTEEIVWFALDRLDKAHLLRERLARPPAVSLSRRQMLRKAALVGGISLLLPVVQSMVAPTPAMAMSIGCATRGQIATPTRPCCAGLTAGPSNVCGSPGRF